MKPSDFADDAPGQCIEVQTPRGERAFAFLPNLLPPQYQPSTAVQQLIEQAAMALGETRGLGAFLPNPALLINGFLGTEAAASTRIEGTRADFRDLIIDQASEVGVNEDLKPDIEEIRNYLEATRYGWSKPEDRPISRSYISELHRLLLMGVRGQHRNPGAFRDHLVHIGGPRQTVTNARFVPPPPEQLSGLVENLTTYIQGESPLPNLVRLAIIHYQFETIHPFSDGNGRLGRLLMPILLKEWGFLDYPMLPLSEYFEDYRDTYIDLLFAVSTHGAWDAWISFVLKAIQTKSEEAVWRSRTILQLREDLRARYQGARAGKILIVIDALFERPAISVRDAAGRAELTFKAANTIVIRLVDDGVLELATEGSRGRVFIAPAILRATLGRMPDHETPPRTPAR